MRHHHLLIAVCTLVGWSLLSAAASGLEEDSLDGDAPSVQARVWDPETVNIFRKLPVQDDGRVKPLHTVADFALLRTNGKRSFKDLDGEKRNSMEWFLDCLFYPEIAEHYRVFLVQTSEVIDAIGLEHQDKKKRDRYSYVELAPGRQKLFELATQFQSIEPKDQTAVQQQVLYLAHNLAYFERLIRFLDFARVSYPMGDSGRLTQIIDQADGTALSQIVEKGQVLGNTYMELSSSHGGEEGHSDDLKAVSGFLQNAQRAVSTATALALFAPTLTEADLSPYQKSASEWWTPKDTFEISLRWGLPQHAELLANLESLVSLRDDPESFQEAASDLHAMSRSLAEARGEYEKIELEVFYYKGKFFYYSLVLFIMGFAMVTIFWLRPANRILAYAVPWTLIAATVLLVTGIVIRCILRGRPPVSTLYETILFITAVIVILCLFIERFNRKRVAISAAAILGAAGVFLANKYEAKEAVDTMPVLVAVLDTNFWLATHVTTISMGYAAGLLAGGLAHIYLLGRLFRIRLSDKSFYRSLSKMIYGVVCFGLLFSLVGTVLGGIWANDSWGRFWGWDPKENGALMIVLWGLAIVHARLGGYIKDYGLSLAAVFGGIIVGFSWWGVNLLGVGLHSYGFTSGIQRALYIFYGVEIGVMALGALAWYLERARSRESSSVSAQRESSKMTSNVATPRVP